MTKTTIKMSNYTIKNFKEDIILHLPNQMEQLAWSVNYIGERVFDHRWDQLRQIISSTPDVQDSLQIMGLCNMINTSFPDDKTELLNFMFIECLKKYHDVTN